MTTEEQMRAHLAQRAQGLEAAREFLQTYVADASRGQLEQIVRHMMATNPFTIETGIDGISDLLAAPQPPGVLGELVARDANRSLKDPSDEAARAWLETLLADVRRWIA
jgi:hypothetical protein